jgi:alginate O-acetyltransferase complex protein AlgI
MLFSSTIFLFAFLPIVFVLHLALRSVRARNALLLTASLFFYTWGEMGYVAILLVSIAINFGFGVWIGSTRGSPSGRMALGLAVTANLLLLASFKYAGFVVDNLSGGLALLGLSPIELDPVHLPIGISFFTFQALTYVVDVHRGDAPAQRSPFRVALYISLFPQLIAGPIVRYRQVAAQLSERAASSEDVAAGLRRFVVGLGKKVLVANTLAVPADRIFAIPSGELEPSVAWLGALCYALQIYFDFAGYSDMAIGLGRCFGFRFPENFEWPYLSRSVREFWRRWHMTLSTFFRDYLYIPLGGNRQSPARTYSNLLAVFLLCGLWHGAAWSFVVWGLVHGAFLVLERAGFERVLDRCPGYARQLYTLLVVVLAWVFFRADTLPAALAHLAAMFGLVEGTSGHHPLALYLDAQVACVLLLGGLCILPLTRLLGERWRERIAGGGWPLEVARLATVHVILLLSAMSLVSGTHNPFIYFRF